MTPVKLICTLFTGQTSEEGTYQLGGHVFCQIINSKMLKVIYCLILIIIKIRFIFIRNYPIFRSCESMRLLDRHNGKQTKIRIYKSMLLLG